MDEPTHVYLRHCRMLGYCTKGIFAACKKYGWNAYDVANNGIEIEKLSILNNYMANELIRVAREEWVDQVKNKL